MSQILHCFRFGEKIVAIEARLELFDGDECAAILQTDVRRSLSLVCRLDRLLSMLAHRVDL